MEEWIWIVLVIFLIIALRNKDKELLSKMSKKEKEKVLKDRENVQKKNMKDLWIVLGIIAIITFIFILWLVSISG